MRNNFSVIETIKNFKNNKAFTLIELMISSIILVICVSSLLTSFITCYGLSEETKNTTIATQDARRVIEQMHSISATSLTLVLNQNWTAWGTAMAALIYPKSRYWLHIQIGMEMAIFLMMILWA
jgi:prepilin-type N-terminal cleavage/methylation domain-containing protein